MPTNQFLYVYSLVLTKLRALSLDLNIECMTNTKRVKGAQRGQCSQSQESRFVLYILKKLQAKLAITIQVVYLFFHPQSTTNLMQILAHNSSVLARYTLDLARAVALKNIESEAHAGLSYTSQNQNSPLLELPQDFFRQEYLMEFVSQHLTLESHECYILIRELRRARAAKMPAREVWSCLYYVAEKHGLDKRCIMPNVVRFYFAADFEDFPFFVAMLKWYIQSYNRAEEAKVGASLSNDNPYLNEAMSLLCNEIRNQIAPVCAIHESAQSPFYDKNLFDEELFHGAVKRTAIAVSVLVKEQIVHLTDIWDFLGSDSYAYHLESIYQCQVNRQLETLRRGNAYPHIESGVFVPIVFKFVSCTKLYNKHLSWYDPLRVWVIFSLLEGEKDLGESMHILLEKQRGLAMAFAPLRDMLLAHFKSWFERGDLMVKFSALFFLAKLLGPHFAEDIDFFQQACNLCQTCVETHKDMVIELTKDLLLPALSLCMNSEIAALSVWSILSKLDCQTRYQVYMVWFKACKSLPSIKPLTELLANDISIFMRDLTFETMGSVGKLIAVLVTRCPIIAWALILQAVFRNKGLVPLIVELVASQCDCFSQDTLIFMVHETLDVKNSPAAFEGDGTNLQEWFKTLSFMTGCLFAQSKYLQDSWLVAHISFLSEQLVKSAASLQLFLDLLSCMSGIKLLTGISDREVSAIGGSPLLKRQVLSPITGVILERLSRCKELAADYSLTGKVTSGQKTSTASFCFSHASFSSSITPFFLALRESRLASKIMRTLSVQRVFRDIHLMNSTHHLQVSLFVFLQFLFIVNMARTDTNALSIISDITSFQNQTACGFLEPYEVVKRMSLRSSIDDHRLHFVDDIIKSLDAQGINPRLNAFFWALEAYDVHVPESEYIYEASRIDVLNKENQLSPEADAIRMRLVDTFKDSYETHKAHVAWMLPHLPKLNVIDTVNFLHKVAMPRIRFSQQDAHFAFCFLARTLDDSLLLLDALFDQNYLLDLLYSTEYEIQGISQFFREVWRDLISWPSQKDLKTPCITQDACAPRTLFREGMAIESNLQRWQEEIMHALCMALNDPALLIIKNALKVLIRIAEFMPLHRDIGSSLIHVQLPTLASKARNSEVAALVDEITGIYRYQKEHMKACTRARIEEDMHCDIEHH